MILFLNTTACPTSSMDTKKATIDSAILNLIQTASKSLKTSKSVSLKTAPVRRHHETYSLYLHSQPPC